MKTRTKLLSFALILGLFFGFLPLHSEAKSNFALPTIVDTAVTRYEKIPIALSGVSHSGRLISGVTYIPLRSALNSIGGTMSYRSATRTATVTFRGVTFTVTDGEHLITVRGRALYSTEPFVILSDGRMYLPVRIFAKIFSLTVSWNAKSRSVTLSGAPTLLSPAETYYNADILYWLSRIISAESRGEPFTGQIAVGCVIMNRVRSSDFPSTVWGVIFDRKNGVQFTPVSNGTVYSSPTASAILAAKVVMEGYSLSSRALFFLEPTISTSRWIVNNRRYLFTIGHHDFYA